MIRIKILLLFIFISGCGLFDEEKEADKIASLPELNNQQVGINKLWSRSIGDLGIKDRGLKLDVFIDSDNVYAASVEGDVFVINRFSGDVKWKRNIEKIIAGQVTAGSNMVFVSDDSGVVHALNANDGSTVWQSQASSEVLSGIATDNNVAVAQAGDSKLQAFDLNTGVRRWMYAATQSVLSLRGNSSPVIVDGLVYAAFDNGKIVAVRSNSGLPEWEQRFVIPDGRSELERVIDVQAAPLVVGNDIYVAAHQGAIVNLDASSGRPKWEQKASVSRSIVEDQAALVFVDGRDKLRAISAVNGSELWMSNLFANRFISSPAIVSDFVVFGDVDGYIHAVDKFTGDYVGRYNVGGGGIGLDVIGFGNLFYVLTNNGTLYAFELKH